MPYGFSAQGGGAAAVDGTAGGGVGGGGGGAYGRPPPYAAADPSAAATAAAAAAAAEAMAAAASDDDVELVFDEAAGLDEDAYRTLKGALLGRLAAVRRVAARYVDAVERELTDEGRFRPVPTDELALRRSYVLARCLNARADIIGKRASQPARACRWCR
ncbi:hypothetical protein I4F81_010165 [Pyropia yezoensis]|uniref:Uncharacterized protein n=1 Tax=Pyropia yezoensis TaxID=2788 RepID=A0ACC3CBN8_PYRYE|nr:hypothetical protein I4F81_010165 [Neopyropia yezoensis]